MSLQFDGITRNKACAFSLTEWVISSDVDKLFLCQSSFFLLTFLERRRLPTLPHAERCELGPQDRPVAAEPELAVTVCLPPLSTRLSMRSLQVTWCWLMTHAGCNAACLASFRKTIILKISPHGLIWSLQEEERGNCSGIFNTYFCRAFKKHDVILYLSSK